MIDSHEREKGPFPLLSAVLPPALFLGETKEEKVSQSKHAATTTTLLSEHKNLR